MRESYLALVLSVACIVLLIGPLAIVIYGLNVVTILIVFIVALIGPLAFEIYSRKTSDFRDSSFALELITLVSSFIIAVECFIVVGFYLVYLLVGIIWSHVRSGAGWWNIPLSLDDVWIIFLAGSVAGLIFNEVSSRRPFK